MRWFCKSGCSFRLQFAFPLVTVLKLDLLLIIIDVVNEGNKFEVLKYKFWNVGNFSLLSDMHGQKKYK